MQEALTWVTEHGLHNDQNISSIELITENPTAFGYLRGTVVCRDTAILTVIDKIRNMLRVARGKAAYSTKHVNRALESLQQHSKVNQHDSSSSTIVHAPVAILNAPPKQSTQSLQPKSISAQTPSVPSNQSAPISPMPIDGVLQPVNFNNVLKDIEGAPVFKKPQPRQLPQSFNGINPSKQRLQQRQEIINQSNAELGITTQPKEIPLGHRPPLDKKPSLAEKKRALLTGDITKYKEQVKLPFFTFTVTSNKEAFNSFVEKWERQEIFSWSVSYQCKVQKEAKDQVSSNYYEL